MAEVVRLSWGVDSYACLKLNEHGRRTVPIGACRGDRENAWMPPV
jgi:hypothetical protein